MKMSEILFPDVKNTIKDFENKYPKRQLPQGAEVTRFAPSPTGFVHIGGIYASLIAKTMAKDTGGVFYLRIEDTDKKREVENGIKGIVDSLLDFNLKPDEGMVSQTESVGEYGPYQQSLRRDIYHTFAKHLVDIGRAYPCFCTSEELEAQSKKQMEQKVKPGYYGQWAVHREMSLDDVKAKIDGGASFTLRLKSEAKDEKVIFDDVIRGKLEMPANDQDSVLIKSDGLPTYHFAHVVDDYLMHTTTVTRADEWLASWPLHLELFNAFNLQAPRYAHIAPIMKMDGSSRRKLSKRKDPEAAVSFYSGLGYPAESVTEYLLNLANSSFEDWRKANPDASISEFKLVLTKMNKSGALFDTDKLNNISKDVISRFSADEKFDRLLSWAKENNQEFFDEIKDKKSYVLQILNIEADVKKRKDIYSWSNFVEIYSYFFDKFFDQNSISVADAFAGKNLEDGKKFLQSIVGSDEYFESKDSWQKFMIDLARELGYASGMGELKDSQGKYKSHIGDLMTFLRVALTKSNKSPDLYEVSQILGKERVLARIQALLAAV